MTSPSSTAVRDIFFQVATDAYLPVKTDEQLQSVKHATKGYADAWSTPRAHPFAEGARRSHSYHAPPTGPQFTRTAYVVDQVPVEVFASSQHFLVLVGNVAPEPGLEQIRQVALHLFWNYAVDADTWKLTCGERLPNGDMRFNSSAMMPVRQALAGGVMGGQLYFELAKFPSQLPGYTSRVIPRPLDHFAPRLRAPVQQLTNEKRCPNARSMNDSLPTSEVAEILAAPTLGCIGKYRLDDEELRELREAVGTKLVNGTPSKLCQGGLPDVKLFGSRERLVRIMFCKNRSTKHGYISFVLQQALRVADPLRLERWLLNPESLVAPD